ncbi:hypothetical protein F5050DRAFT_834761 [Lentinula boryana]|uniref:Mid2 domain-containing protein n=1 Tax=Lentinula boryana TaxID=40481 RepID=A0ABQ8QMY9_9AGAR|nr:hypothetical protein F5050DRAFT_834761 [Lentinula boryana]
MHDMYVTLLIWFTVTTFAFNISIEENPPIFADVPLSWTRVEGDTDTFWFNELQIASDGSLSKILSLQVDGTSSSNGTMTFVFVRTGAHLIQAIDGNTNAAFFNSTNSITAVASNSSDSSSCTPVTSTVTTSPTGSLNSASAHNNNSVVIGATIGTIVPLTIIAAVVVVLCIQRRAKNWKASSGSESPKPTKPNAFSSVFANLTGSRNLNGTITPFVAVPEPHTTSHSKFDPAMRTGSQTTGNPRTRSSFYAPPSSFGEKVLARPSVNAPVSLVATAHVDDPSADQTQSSRSQISNIVDAGTPGTTLPPLTQRQQLLEEEASRLRLQIMGMVNSALSSNQVPSEQNIQFENRQMVAEMERMRAQIEMLEHDRDSSWARGLSDEPPSYLTSIGR